MTANTPFARARPLIVARTFIAGTSAILPLLLARAFTETDYGTYKQLFLVAQTLYFLLQLGLPQSLYFFLPRVARRRPYLVHVMVFLTAMGVLASGAVLLGAPRISGWLRNPAFPQYAPAVAVYLFGLLCSVPLEISLTARGQTRLASRFYLGSELVRTAAMTLPAVLGFGLTGVMNGIAAFALVRVVVTWVLVLRDEASGPWVVPEALKEQLRYALPFGAALALSVPQGYFHQYFVATQVDPAAFAIYAVGLFQLPVIDLLYTPTSEVLMVTLGELDREGRPGEASGVFRAAVSRLCYAFVPLTVFLVVAAAPFIATLFTSRYLAAVPIYRVGVLSALLAILPLDGALRARGQTWQILRGTVVKALATAPAVILGVKWFGLPGAIGGWLVCEVLGKAVLLSRLPRALGARWVELFPWAELARSGGASLIAGVGAFAVQAMVGASTRPMVVLLLSGVAFGLSYVAGLLLVGARLPFELVGLRRFFPAPAVAPKAAGGN